MEHKLDLEYKNGLKSIAEDLTDLRYDKLEEFLGLFSEKIKSDAVADAGRGRTKLSESLHLAAATLIDTKRHVGEAWRISAPYMKKDGSC